MVKDDSGGLFGAFVNEGFKLSGGRYYGTGECFLWKAGWVKSYKAVHAQSNGHQKHHHHLPHMHHRHDKGNGGAEREVDLLEPLEELTGKGNHAESQTPPRVGTPVSITSSVGENVLKFKAFPYSGDNEYFILCEQGFLSVGGG